VLVQSDLISSARQAYARLPLESLSDGIFQREPGKYYTLINYPPLKAMDERKGSDFPFIRPTSNSKRLYLHIPFCSGHCTFCNYRIIVGEADHWPYLRALANELAVLIGQYGQLEVNNILLGGGTPSLLDVRELEFVYQTIISMVNLATPYNILELHPEMVHEPDCEAKIKLLKDVGVNRINVGVQVFDDDVLGRVNRRHTTADSMRLIELVHKYDFDYVNFDLIFGLPGQTLQSWEHTIQQALDLEPTSISPFFCWMKPATPIFQHYHRKREDFPTREEWLLMALMYMRAFEQRGYRFGTIDYYFKPKPRQDAAQPLEISTFLHTDFDVLALGISGYGFINDTRYMNAIELPDYYGAIARGTLPIQRSFALPQDDMLRLNLMYSLRYDYLNVAEFMRRYGRDVLTEFKPIWESLQARGLLTLGQNSVKLTDAGRIFSDEICMHFVSDEVRRRMKQPHLGRKPKMVETYSYMYDIAAV
jgi:oxygen-independent coproporphyrinogen III oxidase